MLSQGGRETKTRKDYTFQRSSWEPPKAAAQSSCQGGQKGPGWTNVKGEKGEGGKGGRGGEGGKQMLLCVDKCKQY